MNQSEINCYSLFLRNMIGYVRRDDKMFWAILAKIQVITAKIRGKSCLNCKYNNPNGFTCMKKHNFFQSLFFTCWENK